MRKAFAGDNALCIRLGYSSFLVHCYSRAKTAATALKASLGQIGPTAYFRFENQNIERDKT